MMLFSFIVGGGSSSRLFQKVREEKGLAYSIYSAAESFPGAGMFTVSALASPKHHLEVIREIRDVLAGFPPVSAGTNWTGPVRRSRPRIILGLETVEARASYEGRTALFHAAELSPDEVLERLDALELDDIDALAAQVLVPEKTALAAAGRVKPSKAYRGMYGG